MNLPDDIEFIFVDDGSNPPLTGEMKNLTFYQTNNKLAWTQGLGRNLGASKAKGEYLFMTDIDHVISKEALEDAFNFTGRRMIFRRQIAVLDENGVIRQDKETLANWGYESEKLDASVHGNTFVMPKKDFDELGGYAYDRCTLGYHPISNKGDDCYFNQIWNRKFGKDGVTVGHDIYMYPLGRFNKTGDLNTFQLFHSLSQKLQKAFQKCT